MTTQRVILLKQLTRRQAQCKLWKVHREGRISASNFKAVARTNPCMPAESLVKHICYPQAYAFSTESTKYVSCYKIPWRHIEQIKALPLHDNLKVQDAEIFISLERPYVGTTPDAIVNCDCCRQGVVEVKCRY